MRLEILWGETRNQRGLLSVLILCSKGLRWAPEQDGLLGAFSRFCMLLLKASYCISFCLSLPTCKMGLIPPTSLKSPGFQYTAGSGRRYSALLLSGIITSPSPCPSNHPVQEDV